MHKLAPIALFVYNRVEHTRRTVSALLANDGAAYSDVFVFCDGCKGDEDRLSVACVHDYVNTIAGFNSITIIQHKVNMGLAASVIFGVKHVLDNYDRVLVFEDDVLCSPFTLNYLNNCLHKYKDTNRVFSISAWSPPVDGKVFSDYEFDVYFVQRFGCWGWATWENRWKQVDWEVSSYSTFRSSKKAQYAFNLGGSDLTQMLEDWKEGRNFSWAIRVCYAQFCAGGVGVYPVCSYVQNIGLDGSGIHCGSDIQYDIDISLAVSAPRLPDDVTIKPVIATAFYNFYKPAPLLVRVINKLALILFKKKLF